MTSTTNPVSRIVRVLMSLDGLQQVDVSRATDITTATLSRRLEKGGWKDEELRELARLFDVPVGAFFTDPTEVRRAVTLRLALGITEQQHLFDIAA